MWEKSVDIGNCQTENGKRLGMGRGSWTGAPTCPGTPIATVWGAMVHSSTILDLAKGKIQYLPWTSSFFLTHLNSRLFEDVHYRSTKDAPLVEVTNCLPFFFSTPGA